MAKNSFKRRSKMSKKRNNLSKRRNKVTRRRNNLSKRRNKVRSRNNLSKRRNKVTRRRNKFTKKISKKVGGMAPPPVDLLLSRRFEQQGYLENAAACDRIKNDAERGEQHPKYKLYRNKEDNTLVIYLGDTMWMDYDNKYGLPIDHAELVQHLPIGLQDSENRVVEKPYGRRRNDLVSLIQSYEDENDDGDSFTGMFEHPKYEAWKLWTKEDSNYIGTFPKELFDKYYEEVELDSVVRRDEVQYHYAGIYSTREETSYPPAIGEDNYGGEDAYLCSVNQYRGPMVMLKITQGSTPSLYRLDDNLSIEADTQLPPPGEDHTGCPRIIVPNPENMKKDLMSADIEEEGVLETAPIPVPGAVEVVPPPLVVDQIPDQIRETVANEGLPFVQLMNKLKYLKRANPKMTTRNIFDDMDSGVRGDSSAAGDGRIDKGEFIKAMKKYFGPKAELEGSDQNKTVVKIFESVDKGGRGTDGKISYEEFCYWLTNNFTENCGLLPKEEREYLKTYGRCVYLERKWFIYYGTPQMGVDDMIDNLDETDTETDHRFTEKDGQIYYRDFVKYALSDHHLNLNLGRQNKIMRFPYREGRHREGGNDVTPSPAGSIDGKSVDFQRPVTGRPIDYEDFSYDYAFPDLQDDEGDE